MEQDWTVTHKWSSLEESDQELVTTKITQFLPQLQKSFCFCKLKSVGRLNGMPCLGPEMWWQPQVQVTQLSAEVAKGGNPQQKQHLSWRHLSLKTNIRSNSTHSEHPGHWEWSEKNYKRHHCSSVDDKKRQNNFFLNSTETWVWDYKFT